MPKLFLRCSFLKCREQTLVESVIVKFLPVSLRIACSQCALKLVSVGMLKNPTFSPFGPVVPFWLQSGTQQYRFCGDLFSFMVKKRYFVQPRFKLHNTLFCIFFCSNPHPPRFHVLVPRLTRAIRHYEFGVCLSHKSTTNRSAQKRNSEMVNPNVRAKIKKPEAWWNGLQERLKSEYSQGKLALNAHVGEKVNLRVIRGSNYLKIQEFYESSSRNLYADNGRSRHAKGARGVHS